MRGAWVLSVCMVLAWIVPSRGSECGLIVPPEFEEDNDVQHRGYYFHPDHCFSVVIPEGVVGRTSSQPSSQHGFGVLLSKAPRASYLYVGGDPGSWLDNDDSPRSLEKVSRRSGLSRTEPRSCKRDFKRRDLENSRPFDSSRSTDVQVPRTRLFSTAFLRSIPAALSLRSL